MDGNGPRVLDCSMLIRAGRWSAEHCCPTCHRADLVQEVPVTVGVVLRACCRAMSDAAAWQGGPHELLKLAGVECPCGLVTQEPTPGA